MQLAWSQNSPTICWLLVWGGSARPKCVAPTKANSRRVLHPPLVIEVNGMVVAYGVGHTCVLAYLVVMETVPLFMVVELVDAIDFVTRHLRAFDLRGAQSACRSLSPHTTSCRRSTIPRRGTQLGTGCSPRHPFESFPEAGNVQSKSHPSSPELGTCMP